MSPVGAEHFLIVSALLFVIGVCGVMISRNLIITFMSVELMLNAANLSIITFSRVHADMSGHVIVFLTLTVAAAEAAVGLALIITLYRKRGTIDAAKFNIMKW
ncbi:MAG: NADH-quinone oxidoreductase subunit NuoK [candidate division Zixibacteria bacterium]|nr:NADH-quinone oxidoreductase subunit NuoK [candidate division Zixibacteria bacterium]